MKTIVAPTDFSAISLNAVNYAADMACIIGADLSLIHVCAVPMAFSEVPIVYNIAEAVKNAENRINSLKEKIIYRTGEKIKIHAEVKQGDVVSEIDNYCASVNPYAVVMGSESADALQRFLFGGKTISAIKQLLLPVVVVPPEVKFASIKKIGLACDFKKVLDTIPVKEIKSIVEAFHAEFHLLHVSPESGDSFNPQTDEEAGWFQEVMEELRPIYHFIKADDVEKGLNEFAENNKLDLLIVVPKKHSLLGKIFQPSHTKQLVLHTHIPVMAIHE